MHSAKLLSNGTVVSGYRNTERASMSLWKHIRHSEAFYTNVHNVTFFSFTTFPLFHTTLTNHAVQHEHMRRSHDRLRQNERHQQLSSFSTYHGPVKEKKCKKMDDAG